MLRRTMSLLFPSKREKLLKPPPVAPKPKRKSTVEDTALNESYVLTVAIDFGTTFSGYAFAFKTSQDDIHMNKNWGENLGHQSYKAPTCVLIGPGDEFVAFGYNAEQRYSELIEANDPTKGQYHLYRHFKMLLHTIKNITRSTKVESVTGRRASALEIFSFAIRYLKDHLLKRLSEMVDSEPDSNLIRWVITVPAIWDDGAKQFMREAAFMAGCISKKDSDQLILSLEPEAASLFCKNLSLDGYAIRDEKTPLTFNPETKYLVIDAGGGTVDITAHEVVAEGNIKELNVPNGGPWGGTTVDRKFVTLLCKVFGDEFVKHLQNDKPSTHLGIMTTFEKVKKHIDDNDENTKIIIQIPWALGSLYRNKMGGDLENAIKNANVDGVSFQNGSLIIDHNASVKLFEDNINRIAYHVKTLMEKPNMSDTSYVMLVGGFGNSKILQHALKNIMSPNVRMLIPAEAELAVVKGAIYYGYNPTVITTRMMPKVYGTDIMRWFDANIHDSRRKRILGGGKAWCDDVFKPFVKKGESIDIGDAVTERRTPVYDKQPGMTIDIFCTEEEDLDEVVYVDAPFMTRLGGIYVDMPDVDKNFDREVNLEILFGGTEIKVKATNSTTGTTAETKIDFLTD